ncbi:MAG: thioredoxin fold domain-containing protein [Desulfobacteraceae bacterium]|nr:thioredoxin fold domain-containing protein [Desulfobacteraceae bacterium]
MKNTLFLATIMSAMMFFPINAKAEESETSVCNNITLATMQAHVPIPPSKVLSKHAVNGICEVILDINGQYVPIYAGKNYVIAGEMFQGKKQLTQTRIDDLKAENFIRLRPDIEKCIALSYTPKKDIKQRIYMITDPVCPFCHQAESQLKEFSEKNAAEFKIIFASVHPPVGRQKAIEAVCRKLSLDDYINGTWKDDNKTDQYQCKEGASLIDASEKITAALGIDGVPVFFLENGQRIDGADMLALESALAGLPVKTSDAKKVSDAK